jgi:hypothetical protein
MQTYKIVPEHVIQESAEISKSLGDEDNSFSRALVVVEEYKNADMTPIILLDVSCMNIMVVAKETYNQKLH